ncbi:hypothetical protein KO500_00060 [Cellulophaga baltica]|uniref:DUF5677 domain-containing protein n=1 Tax=Cellulophaga TaxID=104264 RepID=UPI001C077FB9|nr:MULTISPECIES: DUF5677 domain-containing protein [Cellulophaga]MBU2994807.1 hypothetical protein [Cellulophaga baltica]MDO6766202.1 DUF5677 domain-containing protein [Cellulophaga sp. 1_MG-2023]
MEIDLKTFIALKEFHLLDSVPDNYKSLEFITKASTELIQSIYDSKPKLGEGEVFIETLSIKILLATKSIIELGEGTKVSALTKDSNVKLLDFPSINILTRSIIEAFLTLEYLFFNDLDLEERNFRFYIWQISGYKSRQGFFDGKGKLKENVNEKLKTELEEIKRLKKVIEQSKFYKTIDKHRLYKLDTYGLPRLVSWSKLITQSVLKNSLFETPYKLYSNYAHSEFISLIQMNGQATLNKGSKENNDSILNSLRLVKMINCIVIVGLKNKFEFASKVFEKYDEETKTTILFWNEFGTE